GSPPGGICLILFPALAGKQDRLSPAVATTMAANSSGLRANIFSAIAKDRIPRASKRRRRRNVWHATPGNDHRLRHRTIHESRARFSAAESLRDHLSCGKQSPSVALGCCNPRGTHIWAFVQYGLT